MFQFHPVFRRFAHRACAFAVLHSVAFAAMAERPASLKEPADAWMRAQTMQVREGLAQALARAPQHPEAGDAADADLFLAQHVLVPQAVTLARARARHPEDLRLDWYEVLTCPVRSEDCDPLPALARLQQREPRNAAVWAATLNAAWRDAAVVEAALDAAATASTYDTHLDDITRVAFEAVKALGIPAPEAPVARYIAKSMDIQGTASADDLAALAVLDGPVLHMLKGPRHQGLRAVCGVPDRLDAAPQAARIVRCQTLWAWIVRDGAYPERVMAQEQRVLLSPQPVDPVARERLRRLYWLDPEGSAVPSGFFPRLLSQGSYAALVERREQLGAEPSPQWLPYDLRRSGFVQTGRPGIPDRPERLRIE